MSRDSKTSWTDRVDFEKAAAEHVANMRTLCAATLEDQREASCQQAVWDLNAQAALYSIQATDR